MNISKLALIALLGSALMAFGCSDDTNAAARRHGAALAARRHRRHRRHWRRHWHVRPRQTTCENGAIDPIEPCCEPDASTGAARTRALVTRARTTPRTALRPRTSVTHQLTVMAINGDCNVGYNLDTCDGSSCVPGGLAPVKASTGVDNARGRTCADSRGRLTAISAE